MADKKEELLLPKAVINLPVIKSLIEASGQKDLISLTDFSDNYEFIMENAKEKENMVLAAYSDMKSEYQDLIESEALKELFNNPNAKNDIFDE